MFNNLYKGKKVFVTGHTGFKGSWLALWLLELGAWVVGYSLDVPTNPNHHRILDPDFETIFGDVRDAAKLCKAIELFQPDVIFHMAAQSLVRKSYRSPVETFETNVIGTVNVFEACRQTDSLKAIINITSDKCYENHEWIWGYRETDPMGGHDPYSASKGCSELVTASYRKSFFPLKEYRKGHQTLVASGRAGNVIGGGDWAFDRLIPDMMRAITQNEKVKIRNPQAIRPWQHVLEPLSGYLLLGQKLLEGQKEFAEAWNFGPFEEGNITVEEIADQIKIFWPKTDYEINQTPNQPHEAGMLRLDCSKARTIMQWKPVWDSNTAVEKTALWYRAFYESKEVLSLDDINSYIADAKRKHIFWTEE